MRRSGRIAALGAAAAMLMLADVREHPNAERLEPKDVEPVEPIIKPIDRAERRRREREARAPKRGPIVNGYVEAEPYAKRTKRGNGGKGREWWNS